ncbi:MULTISPECIES: hypothetical protein [unclassified Helicobacter]|uniref:hypothetical protein n=1 Tax=unclassified Helicobacter TaxID=2593540 RepID=UPI000CF01599|nr:MULTISPECIES: hypothetical protein [unclassified Helicobacter]
MQENEYQELALEIIDMLGVAFHFAGAESKYIKKLIDIYIDEIDLIEDDGDFNQALIISIIEQIKTKYPQFFRQDSKTCQASKNLK